MNPLRLTSLLLGFLLMSNVFAQEMPPVVFLNKLSHRLTGQSPAIKDFEALKAEMVKTSCATVTCLDAYFRSYIKAKMNEPYFHTEAILKVYERFGYRAPVKTNLKDIVTPDSYGFGSQSTTDAMIVYDTFSGNKSIDELYLSQKIYNLSIPGSESYLPSFSIDSSNLKNFADGKELKLDFLESSTTSGFKILEYNYQGHPNVSGLFSTNKFLTRYWNSPLNQNRKRAAVIFNLMLCDPMSPALERETQREREIRIALGKSDQKLTEESLAEIHKNRHANQKDCAICHVRLDPIARTMRPMELGISAFPVSGKLRYQTTMDEMKEIPAANFSDLIDKTVKEPKYLDCQLAWLADTYVGKDLKIHPENFRKVLQQAESNGRKVKDIVESLLMLPEFRGLPSGINEPPSFVQAKEIFSNCTECHNGFFRGQPDQIKTKMTRASVCLDLINDGKNAAMPPDSHFWSPSKEEIKIISSWFKEGAPLAVGQPIFNAKEVEKIFDPKNGLRQCRQ